MAEVTFVLDTVWYYYYYYYIPQKFKAKDKIVQALTMSGPITHTVFCYVLLAEWTELKSGK
jgi:hypothetical protein